MHFDNLLRIVSPFWRWVYENGCTLKEESLLLMGAISFLLKLIIFQHYENTPIQIYRKFHLQNLKNFRYKTDIFYISAQNIDLCFWVEIKKNNVYPCKFSDKKLWYFHISAQNIDYGYSLDLPQRGGSNEYQQSMFWVEIRKIMYTL